MDKEDAMRGYFEPIVPCQDMPTRPCIDIIFPFVDIEDCIQYRDTMCPLVCARFGSEVR